MIKEAIILAGGKGTRLKNVVEDVPKPMALVNNKPFLEYQLNYLTSRGIEHVVLSVGYKSDIIFDHFKQDFNEIKVSYAIEDKPLGTGGGIMKAFEYIKGPAAFILNGDTLFDVDLKQIYEFSRVKHSDCTLVLRHVEDVSRYGSIKIDDDSKIRSFSEKGRHAGEGYINGGVYFLNKSYLKSFNFNEQFSIEKDFFERRVNTEHFYGIQSNAYFLDIGIPEDYYRAQNEFKTLPY